MGILMKKQPSIPGVLFHNEKGPEPVITPAHVLLSLHNLFRGLLEKHFLPK